MVCPCELVVGIFVVTTFDDGDSVWISGHHPLEGACSSPKDLNIRVKILAMAGDPKGQCWVAKVVGARTDGVDDGGL